MLVMTRRRLLAALSGTAAAAMGGCAAPPAPAPAAIGTARLAPDAIVAADGARLPLSAWLPEGPPRAMILGLHGFNDYSHAFAGPGRFLAARGFALYAYDQRGFGRAPDFGRWPGIPALIGDLDTASRLLRAKHPDLPFYLLGESMGGAEAMVALTRPGAPRVAGAILVAPAVWDRANMNVFERVALWLSDRFVPGLLLSGGGLNIVPCDNIEVMREMSRDPLVIKETRADAVAGLADLMDAAQHAAASLRVPTLVLYGLHDELVPAAPTYEAIAAMADRPTIAVYRNGYHMLMRDLDAGLVLGDIAAWLADPGAPLPSGADGLARTELAAHLAHAAG